jgi:hypothetical protein
MDELAMNLAAGRVDNRYFKVLIVNKTVSIKVLRKNPAMRNRLGIGIESNPIRSLNGTPSIISNGMTRRDPFGKRLFKRLHRVPLVKRSKGRRDSQRTRCKLVDRMAMRTVGLRERLASQQVGFGVAWSGGG